MIVRLMTAALILSSFLILNCDSSDPNAPIPIPAECKSASAGVNDAVATVLSVVDLVMGGDTTPGVSFQEVVPGSKATITFSSYQDSTTGYTVDGMLNMTNSVTGTTATLTIEGELQLSGGEVSTQLWDVRATLPWDPAEGDFAGDPTRVEGTITSGTLECPAATWVTTGNNNNNNNNTEDPSFVAANMAGVMTFSADGSEWGYPNVCEAEATGTNNDLLAVACNDSRRCVAVGKGGTILTSESGTEWTLRTSGTSSDLRDVLFGAQQWIAVGDGSTLLHSDDDGASWSAVTLSGSYDLVAGAFGSGEFVVLGKLGTLLHSTDGQQWQEQADFTKLYGVTALATDNSGAWVAVAEGGKLARSTAPTQSWSEVNTGTTEHFADVSFGDGRFILVGQGTMGWDPGDPPILYLSDDKGESWSQRSIPGDLLSTGRPLCGIAGDGNGRWVAAGCAGDMLLSTDNGENWSLVQLDGYGTHGIAFR